MDIRVGRFDLHATAGDTPTLVTTWADDAGSAYSLTGKNVSLWVGGTVTDPSDFTDATEVVGTISTNTASFALTVPTGGSTPLRMTLDSELVTVGTLTPASSGTTAADTDVSVTVGDLSFAVSLTAPAGV